MDELDLDISHYTIQELMDLLEIDKLSHDTIVEHIYLFRDQFNTSPESVQFLNEVQDRLLNELDRKGIESDGVVLHTGPDVLNPGLTDTLSRLVNIDSFYRQTIEQGNAGTDNYTIALNEPIKNVVNLTLYSIEIPYSWYTFSDSKGTTGFLISTVDDADNTYAFPLSIPEGNYTPTSLIKKVNELIASALVQVPSTNPNAGWMLTQNAVDGKVYITPIEGGFTRVVIITWFDATFNTSTLVNATINNNLGWYLGFRTPETILYNLSSLDAERESIASGLPLGVVKAPSIVDTVGIKYILVSLTDYKTNRINKGLIGINNNINPQTKFPSYLSADIPRSTFGNISRSIVVNSTAPRRLTAAQIYTINAISETSSSFQSKVRINSSDDSDIFAKIPLKQIPPWGKMDSTGAFILNDGNPGILIVDFSSALQSNGRDYFGPVDISSLKVTLYDDKGNLLGLNGMDWSFTLIVKSIYKH